MVANWSGFCTASRNFVTERDKSRGEVLPNIRQSRAKGRGKGQPPRIFDKGSEQQKEERAESAGIDCSM